MKVNIIRNLDTINLMSYRDVLIPCIINKNGIWKFSVKNNNDGIFVSLLIYVSLEVDKGEEHLSRSYTSDLIISILNEEYVNELNNDMNNLNITKIHKSTSFGNLYKLNKNSIFLISDYFYSSIGVFRKMHVKKRIEKMKMIRNIFNNNPRPLF